VGFLDKLFRRREETDFNGQMKRLGLYVYNDEKLATRIEMYEDFHQYVQKCTALDPDPEKALEEIIQQTHEINNKLHQLAVPFGRAGSENWYAEAMSGWSRLYSMMVQINEAGKALQALYSESRGNPNAPYVQKKEVVDKIKTLYQDIFLRYALLIAEISWMKEDVSPSWSAVINQPTPPAERVLTTMQVPRQFNSTIDEVKTAQQRGQG